MTGASAAGAACHGGVDWQAIDWPKTHQTVRRLQARIVQATQAGRWGKGQALHRLLTHSFSGNALAVNRGTETQGKPTPGGDRVIWETPAKTAVAIPTLRQYGYRARPLRRVYMPKPNGKKRPLGIATMKDRALQALYRLALEPLAEPRADPNSYGVRPGRSPADAIGHRHQGLSLPTGAQWSLEGDIGSCFDQISQEWLRTHSPMENPLLRQWRKAGFLEQSVRHATAAGVPPGASCSPGLATLPLDGLEAKLRERYPKAPARRRRAQVTLARFADDFVITGNSTELRATEVKPLVEQFWRARGLALSPEKTQITPSKDGFEFLGHQVREYHGKILGKPSRPRVHTLREKVRALLKAHAQATTATLIGPLTPLLRGWATYPRHVASQQTLTQVDNAIFLALWQGANRRHPQKPRRWIKEAYFHAIDGRRGVFGGTRPGKAGRPQTLRLFSASRVAIKRHPKITGAAHPFDPAWEVYFEQRRGGAMADDLKGRRKLLYLGQEQDGRWPVWHQPITHLTGWHSHHLIGRAQGGSDRAANRVLLHPNCQRQVHSPGLAGVKPRSSQSGRKA